MGSDTFLQFFMTAMYSWKNYTVLRFFSGTVFVIFHIKKIFPIFFIQLSSVEKRSDLYGGFRHEVIPQI